MFGARPDLHEMGKVMHAPPLIMMIPERSISSIFYPAKLEGGAYHVLR